VPVVNSETSLQIEASKNTFASKDTGKERVFRLSSLIACKPQVYKFKFDLQPGSLTDQVAGEHQP